MSFPSLIGHLASVDVKHQERRMSFSHYIPLLAWNTKPALTFPRWSWALSFSYCNLHCHIASTKTALIFPFCLQLSVSHTTFPRCHWTPNQHSYSHSVLGSWVFRKTSPRCHWAPNQHSYSHSVLDSVFFMLHPLAVTKHQTSTHSYSVLDSVFLILHSLAITEHQTSTHIPILS